MPLGTGLALALGLGSSAAASGAKYLSAKDQAGKDRTLAAETARYSPWTGMSMTPPKDPSLGEAIAGGLGSGLALSQGLAAPNNVTNLFGGKSLAKGVGNPLTDKQSDLDWMALADPSKQPGYKPLVG